MAPHLLLSALLAALPGAQAQRDAGDAGDPDRGLDGELRARLALADAANDPAWPDEARAARVAACLATLARLWEGGRLAELDAEPWIAPELRIAPFSKTRLDESGARGPWTFGRAELVPDAPEERALAAELSDWHAPFTGATRLEHEVLALVSDAAAGTFEARVRLRASGPRGATRAQLDLVWSTTWRERPECPVLIEVRPLELATAELAGHPDGLFTDVTGSACGPALLAELAPGIDHWRATIPSPLEPGSLGHHGLALGDVDGDGREDVYLCRPGGLPNKLLLHGADDVLVDVSAAAGVDLLDYSSSALLADLDGDQDADLVVATGSGLVFFANAGGPDGPEEKGRFEHKLFVQRSLATSLAAADVDADGDLDLYVCGYVSPYEASGTPVPYHVAENGEANVLLRNEGEWRFTDATAELGLDANNRRFTLAASWEDFDADGDADLYVANDFGRNNLYRNDGGRFVDVAAELGALDVAAGMGVTWGDADGDGWMDLYVTNMESRAGRRLTARAGFRPGASAELETLLRGHARGNTLLLSDRAGAFRDASAASGVERGGWGWGALFLDLDGDAAPDLFAPNGFVTGARADDLDGFFWRQVVLQTPETAGAPGESYSLGWRAVRRLVRQGWSWSGNERNAAFLNLGGARFADVSTLTGLDLADDARAAARVDWDGDGDEDLLVTNRTAPMLRVLRNERTPGSGGWIAFTLHDAERTSIGARVELALAGGKRLVQSVRCGEGYLAQSSARLTFGLGAETLESVSVRWPDGTREDFERPEPGAAYVLERGTATARALAARTTPSRLRPSALAPPIALAATRTVLPTPLPLPRLAMSAWDGRPASVLGITMQGPRGTGRPLALVLASRADPTSREVLRAFVAAREDIERSGLQVLGLDVDAARDPAASRAELTELGWLHGSGIASAEALHVLECAWNALHDDARALPLPSAFLVDPGGRVIATYAGRVAPEVLVADLALVALEPEARRDACVPFPGRWVGPLPDPLEPDVAAALAAHGLARPAAEYALARVETRTLSAAQLRYDEAVRRHKEGRLGDAIALYRQALVADGSFARAAQDLAVALHQQGDRPAALTAYKEALRLEPGHALTRCNLGYLHLDLGDPASARAELEALRTLGSELATTLEARIREAGGG